MIVLEKMLIFYHISQILVGILAAVIIPYLFWHYQKRKMLRDLIRTYYAQFLVLMFLFVGSFMFIVRGIQGLVDKLESPDIYAQILWILLKILIASLFLVFAFLLIELYGLKINKRLTWFFGLIGILIYGSIEVYSIETLYLIGSIQSIICMLFCWRLYVNGRKERNIWIASRKKRAAISMTYAMVLDNILSPIEL